MDEITEDPNARWIGMGDNGDYVFYTDHRMSPNSMTDEQMDLRDFRRGVMGQVRKIAKRFEPIADKCIGIHTGNHEEKIANKYHTDPSRELAFALGVPYLGYSALTRIYVYAPGSERPFYSFVLSSAHGTRAPRSSGGKLNVVEDRDHEIEADIFFVAHSHGRVASHRQIIGLSTRCELQRKQRLYMVTSSYLENHKVGTINYAEKAGYQQSLCGSPYAEIWMDNSEGLMMRGVV
jgi:hypothetical protein